MQYLVNCTGHQYDQCSVTRHKSHHNVIVQIFISGLFSKADIMNMTFPVTFDFNYSSLILVNNPPYNAMMDMPHDILLSNSNSSPACSCCCTTDKTLPEHPDIYPPTPFQFSLDTPWPTTACGHCFPFSAQCWI